MNYDNVIVDKDGAIAVVTLNRPQALNALSYGLVKDLSLAMQELDQDPEVRVIVVTGGEKVFAAGADIKEMADKGPFDAMVQERLAYRDKINKISKPVIAAVIGFALGGGCELAMSCDIIVASENRALRPTGSQSGHHPRQRRHPAVDARARQTSRHGAGANRRHAERQPTPSASVWSIASCPLNFVSKKPRTSPRRSPPNPQLAIKAAKEAVLKSANSGARRRLGVRTQIILSCCSPRKTAAKA